ncbi:MAG: 7,8-didemethyl-8-hydroxy-5-deazariboflavin synthase subunit CofG [Methanobacteriaceae archaeon]|nr:7,8-didemethyl-8-hydroxy-5-deazariboflavin synthase subunit CofG [Methanobacteriaceae archaeon]
MPSFSKNEIVSLLNLKSQSILSLMSIANSKRFNNVITYSKNVFLPLTHICRNECGYCTFRKEADNSDSKFLMFPSEVLSILKKASAYECKEALFTFGERPEENEKLKSLLDKLGYDNMVEYLYFLCAETLRKTNILPHSNPGVLKRKELKILKEVNASMGLMLETTSTRLMNTIAHEKSPGKNPWLRIQTIENAGKLKIPFTTGLLIGIGETITERAESLLELRRLQNKYGHIQEIIIQNFKPKIGIPMENYQEPSLIEMVKMVAVTKLLFPDVGIQVPPNLNRHNAQIFLLAGADDWGGLSPLTKDYVNPEAPWPEMREMENLTKETGFTLKERLPVYEKFINPDFLDERILDKIQDIKIAQ